MERNMKIFYLFTTFVLTLFVISCKTVKDTSQEHRSVVDAACKEVCDSVETHIETEDSVVKEVEKVAVGEPPNLFFLYLIIIIALLFFIYIKFIR